MHLGSWVGSSLGFPHPHATSSRDHSRFVPHGLRHLTTVIEIFAVAPQSATASQVHASRGLKKAVRLIAIDRHADNPSPALPSELTLVAPTPPTSSSPNNTARAPSTTPTTTQAARQDCHLFGYCWFFQVILGSRARPLFSLHAFRQSPRTHADLSTALDPPPLPRRFRSEAFERSKRSRLGGLSMCTEHHGRS